MIRWTDRAWWTVDDAARVLRVNRKTLYDACASGDFPSKRVGMFIRIPAEALLMTPKPDTLSRNWHVENSNEHLYQYEFEYDVPIVPIKRYRNGDIRRVGDYETSLSKKKWRNP